MNAPILLIVEDDAPVRRAVAANLAAHGYAIDEAGTLAEAERRWDQRRPDLVILDLGLPDGDGLGMVRRIRREAATPILILSVRGSERDKVEALDLGADDHVVKPFGMGELRARVGALLRRSAGPAADGEGVVTRGAVRLDPRRREVTVAGRPVDLTPREYEILRVLLTHPGRVVTSGRLLRAVWGTAYAAETHYLHVYMSRVRRKLAAADATGTTRDLIVAEPGVGYRIGGERTSGSGGDGDQGDRADAG